MGSEPMLLFLGVFLGILLIASPIGVLGAIFINRLERRAAIVQPAAPTTT